MQRSLYRSRAGIRRSFQTESYRIASFSFEHLPDQDYIKLDEMNKKCGDFNNVLISAYPELETLEEKKHIMLGFIEEDSGFVRQNVPFRTHQLTIGEAL